MKNNNLHTVLAMFFYSLVTISTTGCATQQETEFTELTYVPGKEKEFLASIRAIEFGLMIFHSGEEQACGVNLPTRLRLWSEDRIFYNVAKQFREAGIVYNLQLSRVEIKGYPTILNNYEAIIDDNGNCVIRAEIFLSASHRKSLPIIYKISASSSPYEKGDITSDTNPSLYLRYVGQAVYRATGKLIKDIEQAGRELNWIK